MDVHFDASTVRLETERLLLRPFVEEDLTDLFAYASVPGVGEMAGWPHHTSIETSSMILQSFIRKKEVLAIFHKVDGKVIGSLGLHASWANDEDMYQHLKIKEIGYVLSKDYWGQGLVPEAVQAVIAFGFGNLGLDALSCAHFQSNDQSRRVIEKCGFQFVKESQWHAAQLGRYVADQRYILFNPQNSL